VRPRAHGPKRPLRSGPPNAAPYDSPSPVSEQALTLVHPTPKRTKVLCFFLSRKKAFFFEKKKQKTFTYGASTK
jgi:hypothetical protein